MLAVPVVSYHVSAPHVNLMVDSDVWLELRGAYYYYYYYYYSVLNTATPGKTAGHTPARWATIGRSVRDYWERNRRTIRALSSKTAFCIWATTDFLLRPSLSRCFERLLGTKPFTDTTTGIISVDTTLHMSVTSCARSKYLVFLSASARTRFSS